MNKIQSGSIILSFSDNCSTTIKNGVDDTGLSFHGHANSNDIEYAENIIKLLKAYIILKTN